MVPARYAWPMPNISSDIADLVKQARDRETDENVLAKYEGLVG